MSIQIKYKNNQLQLVTAQQAAKLEHYTKLIYKNNELKREELYIDKNLCMGIYTLTSNETVNSVRLDLEESNKWSFRMNKQLINNYTIYENRSFDENGNEYSTFSKEVYISDERIIAKQSYDTTSLELKSSYKIYYLGGLDVINDDYVEGVFVENAKISFYFDSNGIIKEIHPFVGWLDDSYSSLNSFLAVENDGPLLYHLTPEMLDYYINREPLVPNF